MTTSEVIGIMPCAGFARRIAPLPCSKEIFPLGLRCKGNGPCRPEVVSHHLLEQMRQGGVKKAFIVLRKGKWDIPEYYGDGSLVGMDIGYLVTDRPYGPPYTVDQAYPFVRGARIAMGFPDILLGPPDLFGRALKRLSKRRADLLLGLYRRLEGRPSDMIAADRSGRVHDLFIEPCGEKRKWGWMFAVWTPTFTEFLHEYLKTPRTSQQWPGEPLPAELTMGHVIKAALKEGIIAQSLSFHGETYLDIGTPEGLRQAFDDPFPN